MEQRSRRERLAMFAGRVLARLAMILVSGAWVMVLLGWAHDHDSRIPNLGFFGCVFVLMAAVTVLELHDGIEEMRNAFAKETGR